MSQGLTLYYAGPDSLNRLNAGENLPRVSLDVFHQAGPKLVYLGGSHNCLGLYHGYKFPDLLAAYQRSVPSPTPLSYFSIALGDMEEAKSFVNEHVDVYRRFFRIGTLRPTSYVQRLADELFLPDAFVEQWRKAADPYRAMRDYFSEINIVSYSYGHRIVQQLDVALQDKLASAGLPKEPLGFMRAVAVAATVPPIDYGLIPQLCLARNADMIVTEYFREILFDNSAEQYPVRHIGSAFCVGERSPDNWCRRVVPSHKDGGEEMEFLSQRDKKGHSFRVYTKPPVYAEGLDGPVYFTNSCMGTMFLSAALYMLTAPPDGFSFGNLPFVSSLLSARDGAEASRSLRRWRIGQVRAFRQIKRESACAKQPLRCTEVGARIPPADLTPSPFSSSLG